MDLQYESKSWESNTLLLGIDEAGIGTYSGCAYVGYVIFPQGYDFSLNLSEVNDSKKLTEKKRFDLELKIKKDALYWAVDEISAAVVDARSAYHAVLNSIKMRVATDAVLKNLTYSILFDGGHGIPGLTVQNNFLIKGDGKCYSIAAASILAKTSKDHEMIALSDLHPEYDWANNKGYGTAKHEAAIRQYGLTQHHRRTYCKKFAQASTTGIE
jgi:ribonuclease HII